jgi:hypothetical protein
MPHCQFHNLQAAATEGYPHTAHMACNPPALATHRANALADPAGITTYYCKTRANSACFNHNSWIQKIKLKFATPLHETSKVINSKSFYFFPISKTDMRSVVSKKP